MNILKLRRFAQTERGEGIVVTVVFTSAWILWIVAGYILANYYHFPVIKYVVA